MLLFLLRGQSHRSPRPDAREKRRDYTVELLAAALFLSGWCVLRLVVSRDTSHGFDAALAVSGLAVGVASVVHCLRALRVAQRRVRAERSRVRAAKRLTRAAKRRERAQRRA